MRRALLTVIAKSQANSLPVGKVHGDVAISSLVRDGMQLLIDEIAQPKADRHGTDLSSIKRFIFMRPAMTIHL